MFQRNEPVLLNYTEEDLHPIDLGASGIILPSPFKEFSNILNDTFFYFGSIKENDDWCVIHRELSDGTRLRPYLILKTYLKKHPQYEKCGDNWIQK